MKRSRALVSGGAGQDGTYLIAELLRRGYYVLAASRSPSAQGAGWAHDPAVVESVELDVTDGSSIENVVRDQEPDVIFNLAARSSGQGMFDDPVAISDVNGLAVTRILETVRRHRPATRVCQASSSEVFGQPLQSPQAEDAPTRPRSPYGVAKLYADHMIQLYRQRFGMFACSAILFNHESPLRRPEFVTRKVTCAAAAIKLGLQTSLVLGDLDARRDWGFAGDYVRGMVLMLEQPRPRDFVFATGSTRSVRDLCEAAFNHVGLDYRDYVQSDAVAKRAPEHVQLVGDPSRALAELNWRHTVSFIDLIQMMVDADLERLRNSQPN